MQNKNFIHDDFLLTNDTSRNLYHEFASKMPIIDYHCHLPPQEIANDKTWETITELFKNHFERIAPKSVSVKVTPHHGGQAYVTPIDCLGYKAAEKAYEATFGKTPIPQRSGGSIPIVALFEKELKSEMT